MSVIENFIYINANNCNLCCVDYEICKWNYILKCLVYTPCDWRDRFSKYKIGSIVIGQILSCFLKISVAFGSSLYSSDPKYAKCYLCSGQFPPCCGVNQDIKVFSMCDGTTAKNKQLILQYFWQIMWMVCIWR